MSRWRTRALAAAAAAVLGALVPVWPALAVEPESGGSGHVFLGSGQRFTVSFVHSVDGLPVEDTYVLRDGQVVLESTRVREFGAGMGHIPGRGHGRPEGEWWVVDGIEEPIGDLHIRAGSEAVDHRLRYSGGEVSLSDCWVGERVTVRAGRVSTARRLLPGGTAPECTTASQ